MPPIALPQMTSAAEPPGHKRRPPPAPGEIYMYMPFKLHVHAVQTTCTSRFFYMYMPFFLHVHAVQTTCTCRFPHMYISEVRLSVRPLLSRPAPWSSWAGQRAARPHRPLAATPIIYIWSTPRSRRPCLCPDKAPLKPAAQGLSKKIIKKWAKRN